MATGCGICNSEWNTYEAFISCNGCSNIFHTKCADLPSRVGDALRSTTPIGLKWFCIKCRKFSSAKLLEKLFGSEASNEYSPMNILDSEEMERCRNKVRIRLANVMIGLTIVGCCFMIYNGKQAAKRGESVTKQNLDWHKKYNEDNKKTE